MWSWITIFIFILVVIIALVVLQKQFGVTLPLIGGLVAGITGGFDDDMFFGGKKKGDENRDFDYAFNMKEPWIDQVMEGKKTIDGRKNMAPFSNLQPGNIIKFYNGEKAVYVEVKKVNSYKSVEEFADAEDPKKIMPGAKGKEDIVKQYLEWNKAETVEKYGFLAIHFAPKK